METSGGNERVAMGGWKSAGGNGRVEISGWKWAGGDERVEMSELDYSRGLVGEIQQIDANRYKRLG